MSVNITSEERIEIAENLRSMCAYGCNTEQFYDLLVETVMDEWDFHSFGEVADRLADLIEPEPKVKPIDVKDEYGRNSYYKCPKCEHEVFLIQDHYCSHCGVGLMWNANE